MSHEVSGFRRDGGCLSERFSVPWNCTECLLWLFLLPLFLLTLPIQLYESLDSTGEQQMLTLLLLSQRQLSPAEWRAGRKVRGYEGVEEDKGDLNVSVKNLLTPGDGGR